MTDKSHELLEAALDHLHGMNSYEDCLLKNRIRAYLAEPEVKRDDVDVLVQICVKCRNNEWGPDTPRREILNWFHDIASNALAKQDDDPVAWLIPGGVTERKDLAQVNGSNAKPLYLHPAPREFVRLSDDEPIGYVYSEYGSPRKNVALSNDSIPNGTPVYLHPAPREFVRLSDDEIETAYGESGHYQTLRPQDRFGVFALARAIMDALEEKNK